MKLQLDGQHMRVRIDEDELARLLNGDAVAAHSQFANIFALHATLRLGQVSSPQLAGKADDWLLILPAGDVRDLASRLPTREGMRYHMPPGDAAAMEILFDVDVRDSTRRRRAV